MEDLRMLLRMKKIPTWKVAEVLNCSEMTIYRWLRTFNQKHHDEIMKAIEQIEGDSYTSLLQHIPTEILKKELEKRG